jgi:predicted GTPase
MVTITAPERLVLQALVEGHGDFGKPVPDLFISDRVAIKLETVRTILQMLQEKELVALVFTERGLVSFIEAKGRLLLSEIHAASAMMSIRSKPVWTSVVVAGLTGTGKSFLINKVIGRNEANVISIFPGTIELQRVRAEIDGKMVEFIDCPGLGSGRRFDTTYFETYKQIVAECSLLIWTIRADTRVVTLDEDYFLALQDVAFQNRVRSVLVLTFCDRMQPGTWLVREKRPDDDQQKSLELRTIYLSGLLQVTTTRILSCSAIYNYGISSIRTHIAAG